jgi:hypothetical protein
MSRPAASACAPVMALIRARGIPSMQKEPERVYFGHRLVYDRKAAAHAAERTRKFLEGHLRR